MDDRLSEGDFRHAEMEDCHIYCVTGMTQADIFMDIAVFLMNEPDALVLASSFGYDVEAKRHSADVAISMGMKDDD